tara:strand:- start:15437 stop:16372 length:936 start_codon:yes stop_codon:yes gene_type:complete
VARRKKGRAIDGVVLLDKPYGGSSNRALQKVRRLLNAQKAGHTGSLDPLATGLLPICLGEATKLSAYLLSADKRYRVTADLRFETATGDIEGEPTEYSQVNPPESQVLADILSRFVGDSAQIPPMYSALKVDGKPLYAYARAGEYVERSPRPITVSECTLAAYEPARQTLTLDVAVSGGTYVRTLVEDIARAWGGRAHVSALRRTGVGSLVATNSMTSMADIERDCGGPDAAAALPAWLRPVSTMLAGWPTVLLEASEAERIGMGQTLGGYSSLADGAICLKSPQGQIIGLGQHKPPNGLAPLRLFSRPLD